MTDYFSNPLRPAPLTFHRALIPLMTTIWAQGNSSGEINYGDMRDSRQSVTFNGPFDFVALHAVYDFADSIQFVDGPGAWSRIDFLMPSGERGMSISSLGGAQRGFQRRNHRWWKKWNATPRERVFFDNPYSPSWEPLARSGRRILASESLEAALFPLLAAEAARGNYGWSRRRLHPGG